MNNSKFLISIILLLTLVLSSCNSEQKKFTIAITKANNIESNAYVKWLKNVNSNIEIINMYSLGVDSALKVLDKCSGLLVTGGEDVYPDWYGQIADTVSCEDFDFYRDTLEIELIHKAIEKKLPIFGICRGEQIINVALGGSLITDIPTQVDTLVIHRNDSWDCFHSVNIIESSKLNSLINKSNLKVNSYHHQAVDRIAENLKITALSNNKVVEAVEWNNFEQKGFLMAVQWHPEHLDTINPNLSIPLAKKFIEEVEIYNRKK